MRVIRAFVIAFSMYSRIPMPQLTWREEDMEYAFCFFPWVGAVTGGVLYLWGWICGRNAVGDMCRVLVSAAIPLLVTGGIHVDGFLDAMDAFHSYRPKETKLEIMDDAHIGGFSVILFAVYGLLYLAALAEIGDGRYFPILCAEFFFARCLSGIGALSIPGAKQDGLLAAFVGGANRRVTRGILLLQAALCAGWMIHLSPAAGGGAAAAGCGLLWWYSRRCRRELGGVTGDTAGYFVVLCEVGMAVVLAGIPWIPNVG